MKRLVLAATAAAAIIAVSPAAAQQVTFYNTLASFQAALGQAGTLENFNNSTLAPGLTINSTNGTISGGVFNDQLASPNAIRTDFIFSSAQNGFGGNFDLTPGGAGLGIQIRLVGSGGLLSQEIPNTYSGQFFGFISSVGFTDVRLVGGTQAPNGSLESYTLDNLRFGAAVPEPATWAMMLFGFGAIGATVRRRQKVTARIRFA